MSKNEETSLKLNNKKNNNINFKNEKQKFISKTSNKSNNKSQTSNSLNNFTISKDGTEVDLSGNDLSSKEGQILLNNIISRNKNLTKLILNKCNIISLPKELINLNKLSSLDLCNNKFQNFELLIQDLANLHYLEDLQIDISNQNQVLQLLSKLPKLNTLNGKSTKNVFSIVDVELKDIEDISLSNNLDYYNEIIKYINEKEGNNNFGNKFQIKINEEGKKINNCLNKNIPNYIYANVTLESQIELQKCLSEKYLEFLDEKNKNIGTYLFKMIFQSTEKLINLLNNLYPKIVEKTENLRNEIEKAQKAAKELSDYEFSYNDMKNNKLILETNLEVLQKKVNKLENENKFMIQKMSKNSKEMIKNNEINNNINNSINNKNYSYTYNYVNQTLNKTNSYSNKKNIKNNQFNTFNPNIPESQNQLNSINNNNFSTDINNMNNNFGNNINGSSSINNITKKKLNPLSENLTKEIINDLYNSKEEYDRICYKNKLPNETLLNYMYIYLQNKYGLKNLVIEWANAITDAINSYSKTDCDINLFGKILNNEQEEGSRLVLIKLKESIAELLEYFYKMKHEFKTQEEINEVMNKKKKDVLLEEEWKEIIQYIYNEEDAQILESKIISYIKEQNEKIFFIIKKGEEMNNDRFITERKHNNLIGGRFPKKLKNNMIDIYLTDKKRVTREKLNAINSIHEEANIPYTDFIQLVCENQIQNRENYLKNFVILFKKYDTDEDGILSEKEFIDMISSISYCQNNLEEYTEKFLEILDPFNHKRVIFNDCVNLFSNHIIDDEMSHSNYIKAYSESDNLNIGLNIHNETSLLDKICLGN